MRGYKGQVSVKENGNVSLQSYQDVMGALRGRLMLLSSEGASRLPIDDLVQYQAILQRPFSLSRKGDRRVPRHRPSLHFGAPTSNRRDASIPGLVRYRHWMPNRYTHSCSITATRSDTSGWTQARNCNCRAKASKSHKASQMPNLITLPPIIQTKLALKLPVMTATDLKTSATP